MTNNDEKNISLTNKYVHAINNIISQGKISPDIKYMSPNATKIIPGLFLGNINDANNIDFLKKNNIRAVVNISYEKLILYDGIDYYQFYVTDDDLCNYESKIIGEITQVLNCIHEYLSRGMNVLVHCKRGHHRSASIISLYLTKYCNFRLHDSVSYIKSIRPTSFRRFPCVMYNIIAYCILFCNN